MDKFVTYLLGIVWIITIGAGVTCDYSQHDRIGLLILIPIVLLLWWVPIVLWYIFKITFLKK